MQIMCTIRGARFAASSSFNRSTKKADTALHSLSSMSLNFPIFHTSGGISSWPAAFLTFSFFKTSSYRKIVGYIGSFSLGKATNIGEETF